MLVWLVLLCSSWRQVYDGLLLMEAWVGMNFEWICGEENIARCQSRGRCPSKLFKKWHNNQNLFFMTNSVSYVAAAVLKRQIIDWWVWQLFHRQKRQMGNKTQTHGQLRNKTYLGYGDSDVRTLMNLILLCNKYLFIKEQFAWPSFETQYQVSGENSKVILLQLRSSVIYQWPSSSQPTQTQHPTPHLISKCQALCRSERQAPTLSTLPSRLSSVLILPWTNHEDQW